MAFLDLFKKKTLQIMKEEGVTKQDVQASRNNPAVIAAAARVANHAIPLGRFYAQNTWCGEIPSVTKEWQTIETETRNMAKAMKRRGQIRA